MAKFELPIYDFNGETETVLKTYQRNKMPISLFLKYQKLAEKLTGDKVKSDSEMFVAIKDLILETFPAMTEEEYLNNTDVAEVLFFYNKTLRKATEIQTGNSKN